MKTTLKTLTFLAVLGVSGTGMAVSAEAANKPSLVFPTQTIIIDGAVEIVKTIYSPVKVENTREKQG